MKITMKEWVDMDIFDFYKLRKENGTPKNTFIHIDFDKIRCKCCDRINKNQKCFNCEGELIKWGDGFGSYSFKIFVCFNCNLEFEIRDKPKKIKDGKEKIKWNGFSSQVGHQVYSEW